MIVSSLAMNLVRLNLTNLDVACVEYKISCNSDLDKHDLCKSST